MGDGDPVANRASESLEGSTPSPSAEEMADTDGRAVLPVSHPNHDCWYCEDNAYDQDDCSRCDGEGCDYCHGHGFAGYSW